MAYAESDTPVIDRHQANHEQRIDKGIESGQLNQREVARLNRGRSIRETRDRQGARRRSSKPRLAETGVRDRFRTPVSLWRAWFPAAGGIATMRAMSRLSSKENVLRRLRPKRRKLLRELGALADGRGMPIYLVGGVVRDLFLRRENWDLDIAVEGDGIAFARLVADRYRAGLAVFERFATARLVLPDGLKLDIASTRRESYAEPAALPAVAPASLKEDLHRRDFTINAMAVQLNAAQFGRLHDPFGGRRDLAAGSIRVLHEDSFLDDPTRIFRAIRFAQRFGFVLERKTQTLLRRAAATNQIERLSGPRLCNEVLSLLAEREPAGSIASLVRLKLLRFLHPRLRYGGRARRLLAALPQALAWWRRQCPDRPVDRPLLYLMALLSTGSPAVVRAVERRLQLSSVQAEAVACAGDRTGRPARVLCRPGDLRPSRVYRLLIGLPDEALVLMLAKVQAAQQGAAGRRVRRRLGRFVKRDRHVAISVNGDDLKQIGLAPGPRFKEILDRLVDARLDGAVKTEAQERDLAREMAASRP